VTLEYGATTVDVTPALGPMAGYLARGSARATRVHDRLAASLLWLRADGGSVCWVALDALSSHEAVATRIREGVAAALGIPVDAVLVCCSHTHSGPATWQHDDTAIDRLVAAITRGAARLPATMSPVTAGWACVPQVGVGANRYDPAGPHDASAGVLSLCDAEGAVVAVLADYACHPTVLSHANLEYSADYPAATRHVLGATLVAIGAEAPPVILFLQGAAGDVSTRFTRRSSTFTEADRQGGMLAGALLRGVLAGDRIEDAAPVVLRGSCDVPTRTLPDAATAARTVAQARAAWTEGDESPAGRIARTRYEGALSLADLVERGLPDRLTLPVTVVAFGDVAWLHLPVEPFTSVAERIRAASPFPVTRVVGYTDGYFGYLADDGAHRESRYEALSGFFEPSAVDLLVDRAVALLGDARI
jgi:hypothetical protein